MRLLLFLLAICAGIVWIGARAEAQNYPWCSYYTSGGGGTNCGSTTFQQCLDNMRGIGGAIRNISRRPDRIPCRRCKAATRREFSPKPREEQTNATKESVRFPASPFEPV